MSKYIRCFLRVALLRACRKTLLPGLFLGVIFLCMIITFVSFFSSNGLDEGGSSPITVKRKIHQVRPFARPRFRSPPEERLPPSGFVDVQQSEKFKELKKQKSLMTAIAMQEQGVQLSANQQKLIDDLSEQEKAKLVLKFQMLRLKQEELHVDQLRKNGHIQSLPDGGEIIIASRAVPLRFPSSLKTLDPKDWPEHHKIYLNLTYHPWEHLGSCSKLYTSFAPPGSLKTAALASFPSSGNSWMRNLIDCASGIFTGSLYGDSSLTRKGLFGEGVKYDSGMTLIQKTHGFTTGESMHLSHSERLKFNHMDELSHRGVIIIRNPFKALISHRNLDIGGHTGYAPRTEFEGIGWDFFVKLKIMLWKDFYKDWLEFSRPEDICVVFYEDLKNNSSQVLRSVLSFLSRPVNEERLECIAKHTDISFLRKPPKVKQFVRDPFRRELKDSIYEAIDDLNEVLQRKGHKPLPVEDYEFYDQLEAKISRDSRHKGSLINQL